MTGIQQDDVLSKFLQRILLTGLGCKNALALAQFLGNGDHGHTRGVELIHDALVQ